MSFEVNDSDAADRAIDQFEAELDAWMQLSYMDMPDLSETSSCVLTAGLGAASTPARWQRVCGLGLRAVAYSVQHDRPIDTRTRAEIGDCIAQHADWQTLLQDPAHTSALLVCLFSGIYWKMQKNYYTRWTAMLREWLPENTAITLHRDMNSNQLADQLFGPAWRVLSEVDFERVNWLELGQILRNHPPLVGRAPSSPVTLPTTIIEY